MLLGAKGPPLPTIKNGLETLRRRLPTVSHGHAWSSCLRWWLRWYWIQVVLVVVLVLVVLVVEVVSVLGLSWVVLGHIKATQGNAQEGEEGAR